MTVVMDLGGKVVPGGQGVGVLSAQHAFGDGQQVGVLVAGGSRVPRSRGRRLHAAAGQRPRCGGDVRDDGPLSGTWPRPRASFWRTRVNPTKVRAQSRPVPRVLRP